MAYGMMPATKDEDGNWLFTVMETDEHGNSKFLVMGTEPGENGMKEPKAREYLASVGLSTAQIDHAIAAAIPKTGL